MFFDSIKLSVIFNPSFSENDKEYRHRNSTVLVYQITGLEDSLLFNNRQWTLDNGQWIMNNS